MITIPVQLSEELAERVRPLQDRLPEIIELGLRQWRKQPALTPRQRVEQLWEAQGLVEPAVSSGDRPQKTRRKRQAPIPVGGQPASEIIIEQRGALWPTKPALICNAADGNLLAAAQSEGLATENPNDHP